MKKLYSLFALIALLFTASGCEDDYRSMVLFEGVEPIYQIGTCDNLVSNLSYYLSETNEDTVLGIDGGDGSYNVINEHESVASVTFTDDVNGYQRIKIHPLAEGETIVKVMDGSGEETQLRITVKGRRQYTLTKMGFEYGISSGAPTELLGEKNGIKYQKQRRARPVWAARRCFCFLRRVYGRETVRGFPCAVNSAVSAALSNCAPSRSESSASRAHSAAYTRSEPWKPSTYWLSFVSGR